MKSRYIVSRLLIVLFLGAGFIAGPSLGILQCRYIGTRCSSDLWCGNGCPTQVYEWYCPDGTIIEVPTGYCCICT